MTRYRFALATAEHDAALRRRIAGDWMDGRIALSFRREPSFFAGCCLHGDQVQTIACFDDSRAELVGLGSRASSMMYVNGMPVRAGYLSDLRCHPDHRGGTLLARGYRYLRALHEAAPLPFYATVIYEGNEPAANVLQGARAGLPSYRSLGRVLTPAIRLDRDLGRIELAGLDISTATQVGVARVLAFLNRRLAGRQFGPMYTIDDLTTGRLHGLRADDMLVAHRAHRIVGTLALWDQGALRQTHVAHYRGWLGPLRPVANLAARLIGARPLPAPGERIPFVYFACFTVEDDDLAVGRALLRAAYRCARSGPWHFAICGLHERDPLAALLSEYRSIASAGRLFVVHYPEDADAVDRLDDRPPYLEAGCL